MLIFGLTGGIASGKSTVARMFATYGAKIYDADRTVHRLLSDDTDTIRMIAKAFPEAVTKQKIDRQALAKKVFNDDAALHALEAILHPRVRSAEYAFCRKQRQYGTKLVICDIPLLFETGDNERFDTIVTLYAPQKLRKQRAFRRKHMTEARFKAVASRQWSDYRKRQYADYEVATSIGLPHTAASIKEILAEWGCL